VPFSRRDRPAVKRIRLSTEKGSLRAKARFTNQGKQLGRMGAAVVKGHSPLTYSWLMKDHVRFFDHGGTSPGEAPGVSGRLVDQRPRCPGICRSHRAPSPRRADRGCRGGGPVRLLAGGPDGGYGRLLGLSGGRSAWARPGRSRAARSRPAGDPYGGRHRRPFSARRARGLVGGFSPEGGHRRASGAGLVLLELTRVVLRRPHGGRPAPAVKRFRGATGVRSRGLGRALSVPRPGRFRLTSRGAFGLRRDLT
jgi:hypothetical protein